MGSLQVSVSNRTDLVLRKQEGIEQTLQERMEVIDPYLTALEAAKASYPATSSDYQTFDVLCRLLEMTDISNIRDAERVAEFHSTYKPLILDELEEQT